MKAETKHSIGDTVFFLRDKYIRKGVITGADLYVRRDRFNGEVTFRESYTIDDGQYMGLGAEDLFTTPEELAKSLTDKFYKR